MIKCCICGVKRVKLRGHLRAVHNTTLEGYYQEYLMKVGEGVCLNCGSKTKFNSLKNGYHRFCSLSCVSTWANSRPGRREFQADVWRRVQARDLANPSLRKKKQEMARRNGKKVVAMWKNPTARKKLLEAFNTTERKEKLAISASVRMKDLHDGFSLKRGSVRYGVQRTYNGTRFRSGFEAKFAERLDKKKVEWEYERATFVYNGWRRYTPDFFLPKYNLYLELKPSGLVDSKVHKKLRAVRCTGEKAILVTERTMKAFVEGLP